LTQLLLTIGITFFIIGVANFIFGPTSKPIPLPPSLSGPLDIGFRSMCLVNVNSDIERPAQ